MNESIDQLAQQALENMRRHLARARKMAQQEPYETVEGDFGVDNWAAIAARKGLNDVARLHGFGADWLSRQPTVVQSEVADAQIELERIRATAVIEGAHVLPVDLPPDPFSDVDLV